MSLALLIAACCIISGFVGAWMQTTHLLGKGYRLRLDIAREVGCGMVSSGGSEMRRCACKTANDCTFKPGRQLTEKS